MSRRGRKSQAAEDDEDDEVMLMEEEEEAPRRGRPPKETPGAKTKAKTPASGGDGSEPKKRGRPKGSASAKKKKADGEASGDDEEGEPRGAGAKNFDRLPHAEQKKLVAEVVRLLLLKHQERIKVTGADVSKYVLRNEYAKMKVGQELLRRAGEVLQTVFGMQLVQQDKLFFLRNTIHLPDAVELLGLPPSGPIEGLAAVVIGMLHTNKTQKIEEGELFEMLSALDFREDVEHKVFGKWKDAVQKKLAQEQRYVNRKKEKDQHGDSVYYYTPGPRMMIDYSLHAAEALVSEVYGRAVNPDKIKELEMERGLTAVPESAPKRAPSTRGKKRASAATDGAAKRKEKLRRKFADEEEEEEDADLFEDDDE